MDLGQAFIDQSRDYLTGHYLPKIERSVAALTDAQIWWRPNDASNSVGNLLLHLAGNIRQWIVTGIGGAPDARARQEEFDERGPLPREEALGRLRRSIADADAVLAALPPARLTERRTIQQLDVTTLEAIYHVVEHCSMHAGQIISIAKGLGAGLEFYAIVDGKPEESWRKSGSMEVRKSGSDHHLSADALTAGLDAIRLAPRDVGRLELIVRRPQIEAREILDEAELDLHVGVVGDTWNQRSSGRTDDGSPHPDMQINIMNARSAALIARTKDRWPLAGDQLFVDLDLSGANLPPGTRLAIGSAVLQVTDQPHTGCAKFVARFGLDAMKFVNSTVGRELNLRGINARVVQAGRIHAGDAVRVTRPA